MARDKICSTTFTAKVGEEIINKASYYGTNHPQLKRHTHVTRVCVAYVLRVQKQKTSMASNHSCTRVCTHLHACKMNAPYTRTYPYEVSATK